MVALYVMKARCCENGKQWQVLCRKEKRKGAAMRLALRCRQTALCILTTTEPYTEEEERLIFAVFLVERAYDGDSLDEGFVSTQSRFKMALSPKRGEEDAVLEVLCQQKQRRESLLGFWSASLHNKCRGGLRILSDIAALKKGTEDEALAQEFLDVFLK